MRRRIVVAWLAALASLAGTLPAWAIGPEKPNWHAPEVVIDYLSHPDAHSGASRILAYDHYGRPGVAISGPSFGLLYARRVPGYGWGIGLPVITGGWPVGSLPLSPSVAFDRHELPVVGCGSGGNGTYIARLDADNVWHEQEVASEPSSYCSVAVDLYGRMAMAWYDETFSQMKFAYDRNDNGVFDTTELEAVRSGGQTCRYVSLAFDPANRPMVALQNTTGGAEDLMFAVRDAGTRWLEMTVDSAGSQGWMPSLAINPMTGFPAIAYAGDGGANLRYAEWNGEDWLVSVLPNPRENGITGVSLAFDPEDGNPAIAYHEDEPLAGGRYLDWDATLLAFTWRHEDTWENQVVAWQGNTGLHPSLAFNDYGTGWAGIAYLDAEWKVWYIEDPPAVPEPATLALLAGGAAALAVGRGRRNRRRA
jgi:hypothetical protein